MAILTKQQLKTLRGNVITTNGVGEITGANLGSFTDDFIDSVYNYVDTSTGTTDLGDLEVVGTSLRNISNTGTFIGLTNEVNIGSNNSINISSSNELFLSSTNTAIYSADTHTLRINTPTPVNKVLIDILKVTLVGDTDVTGDLVVDGSVQSSFKSSDGSVGITETFQVSNELINRTITIKDGIVTNITSATGWDVQIDVFDSGTTNDVLEGATIDVYPEQSAPPVGTPLASYTTNSIGRVTFQANPNSTYRLHIYKATYDDIYPELIVDTNPKLVNYELPFTG